MSFVSNHSAKRWVTATLLFFASQTSMAVQYEKNVSPERVVATIPPWMQQTTGRGKDVLSAAKTVAQLLDAAAREGDERALGRARALLDPWWEAKSPPPQILLQRARYKQRVHQFGAAERDFKFLVNNSTIDELLQIQALLGIANTQILLGKNKLALSACKQIPGARFLYESLSCQARVFSVNGQLDHAITTYRALLTQRGLFSEQIKWLQNALGELYWVATKPVEAHAMLSSAAADARNPHLIKTYADFLIDQHQPREILRLIPIDTQDASLLLRRVIAEKMMAQPGFKKSLARLNSLKNQARLFGRKEHLTDSALFAWYIEADPNKAQLLARKNLAAQKDVADRFLEKRTSLGSLAQNGAGH